MRGGVNLRDLQQKRKEQEDSYWVKPKPCIVCKKVVAGPYGRDSEDNWTCNSKCEGEYRASLSRQRHEQAERGCPDVLSDGTHL